MSLSTKVTSLIKQFADGPCQADYTLLEKISDKSNTFENVTDEWDLKKSLNKALDQVENILNHHSGPFATNAIIGSRWRQINDVDEFTKDGISILNHLLVSEDVAARAIVRMARYVGIAVDARCHDGTTTSMLAFCTLARVAIEEMTNSYMSSDRYVWVNELKEVLGKCLAHLDKLKITDQDIADRCRELDISVTDETVRGAIAYHMAMISSKGDHDLASKIAHIIRSTPRKIYGMYRTNASAVETVEPYILKKQESDLSVTANLGNMDHFNYKNDTQYKTENAVIFATNNTISVHSMESGFLQAFISTSPRARADLKTFGVDKGWEEYHEGVKNLIILSPLLDDPGLMETINRFNYSNPQVKISWFNYHVDHKLRTSFNKTLHYMATTPLFEDVMFQGATKCLVGLTGNPVTVHLLGSHLAISNLYERDGGVYHPLYTNPEVFQPYTDFCKETEEIINFAQENISNASLDHSELNGLMNYYRALTCQEIWDIEVGGSKHDQRANQTVYEDAIGAALSAVDEGVVLGGYGHLANLFEGDTYMEGEIQGAFVRLLQDSLRIENDNDVYDLLSELGDKWSYIIADQKSYAPGNLTCDYVSVETLDEEKLKAFLRCEADNVVLLQAYAGYHEQFKRFIDILPRLGNSTHLIDMRRNDDRGGK